MAKLTPMAPDSAGFQTLLRLYDAGGKRSLEALASQMWTGFQSAPRFHQVAVGPLCERGLARMIKDKQGQYLVITAEGRLMVMRYKMQQPAVTEAYKPGFKPLNTAKHGYTERRPGAHDYRKLPSVMGCERVPFHGQPDEAPGK